MPFCFSLVGRRLVVSSILSLHPLVIPGVGQYVSQLTRRFVLRNLSILFPLEIASRWN
jgi:hypothetical protein